MKLYELTQNYLNLQELLEDQEIPKEIVIKALEEVDGDLEDKAENIAKLMKSLELECNAIKEEETRLSNRRKAMENKNKGLKEYLENTMKATGKLKFKGKLFSFNIHKNTPSLKILDESLLDDKYYIVEKKIDNKAIKNDIKNGVEVPGASLIQTESLRIR